MLKMYCPECECDSRFIETGENLSVIIGDKIKSFPSVVTQCASCAMYIFSLEQLELLVGVIKKEEKEIWEKVKITFEEFFVIFHHPNCFLGNDPTDRMGWTDEKICKYKFWIFCKDRIKFCDDLSAEKLAKLKAHLPK